MFHAAVANDPKDHVSLINLAEIFDENKKTVYAVEYSMRAVLAAPEVRTYKQKFINVAAPCVFTTYSADLEKALHICLDSPEVAQSRAGRLWENLLRMNPRFSTVYKLRNDLSFDREAFDSAPEYSPLLSSFFRVGLKTLNVNRIFFEDFLTHLRGWLLQQRLGVKQIFSDGDYIKLAGALSHYCHYTDYIFYTSPAEQEQVAQLRERIETEGGAADERDIVTYACYEPLHRLTNAKALKATSIEGVFVLKTQISDYFDLQEKRKSVVALTEIDDSVSKEVQEQYEGFPYPRWKSFPIATHDDRLVSLLSRKGARVLVAGCGTGQDPLMIASAFPGLEILSVDLSRSSLAYAMQKAEQYGFKNVTFRHADILKLGKILDTKFDYICSTGVLHHMKEPRAGLRVLCDLLKPGGILRLGLYSKLGRQSIIAARKAIDAENYSNTAESMRQFRHHSPRLLSKDVLNDLQNNIDYYTLPMYRDLLFHVQEHRYDTADIEKMLRENGLQFDTFFFPDENTIAQVSERYLKMFPGDNKASDLGRWSSFEKKYPDTFRSMYQFWCRKVC